MITDAPFYTLSQVTSEFCILTFNDRKKYYQNYLMHAKWIWKDLFKNTLMSYVNKWVKVDKTARPYKIKWPKDAMRIYNVSVTDEFTRLRSLATDDAMDTLPMPTTTCSCGTQSLNACFSNISMTTDTIYIDGDPYTQKIWKQLCDNGDVLEIKETPVQKFSDSETWEIDYITTKDVITNVDTLPCGCVVNTPSNVNKIVNICGCSIIPRSSVPLLEMPYQQFGTMKIMRDERVVYLGGNIPDWVQLSYQTNGDAGEEAILVPEYAVKTMFMGMNWQPKALSKNLVGVRMEARAKYLYELEKEELDMYLNPIRMEDFMNKQMIPAKWGAPGICGPNAHTDLLFANLMQPKVVTSNTYVTNLTEVINKTGVQYDKIVFNDVPNIEIAWPSADLPILDVFFDNGDGTFTGPVRGLPPPSYNATTGRIFIDFTGASSGFVQVLRKML